MQDEKSGGSVGRLAFPDESALSLIDDRRAFERTKETIARKTWEAVLYEVKSVRCGMNHVVVL